MRTNRLGAIVLALLTAGCAGSPDRGLLSGLERRVLANGLAVVVKEDSRLPTVTAMLAYRVGSVNEPPGLTGVSHFFEHMVFKGTGKYNPGDIDLVTYRCGGENNAYTTHDMTGYWFHVNAAYLDEVLDILADTMGNCTLDPKQFELERGPVLQEMNLWLDGPWGELERELEKTIYRQSRYRHPVLGWREDVEKLARDPMMAYYRKYYNPNNASLVVVGDVSREDVFRRAEKFFGSIPRGADVEAALAAEPPQDGERTVEVKTLLPADRMMIAFRTGPAGSDADLTLDVIATILGEGRTSRLQKRLVEKEDLAGEGNVDVFNYSRKHEGVFYVQVELALDVSVERAREVVAEELEALSVRPVEEQELRRAKNILRAHFAFEVESQYELASKIGYFEALDLPDYVRDYMDRIEAITPEQVQAEARRTFTSRNRTVGIGRAPGRRGSGSGSPEKQRRRAPLRGQSAPSLGEVYQEVLPNGLTILIKRQSEVPVLSIQALVEAGSLYEPEDKAGLAELAGELLDEGVDDGLGRSLTGDEIAAGIEFVGGQYSTSAHGVAVKVLSEHSSLAFDLVRDLLRNPSFPEGRFEKLREDVLAEIELRDEDPTKVARRLFYEEAYRGHPWRRPALGTQDTVGKITREDVKAHFERLFRPENTILAIAGDIDPKRAAEEIRSRLETWTGRGAWDRPRPPPAVRQTEPRTVYRTFKSQQVRIHLGHVGIVRTNPDYAALRVMETILCSSPGFTNRLARTVRDAEGLAYDVAGSITGGAGAVASPFQVVLGVEAKNCDKGLRIVMDELRRFRDEGPTERETEDARRYLQASFVSAWETSGDVAAWLLEVRRHGLGVDEAARHVEALGKVTPEEVRRVAKKYVDLENLTTVMVGPIDANGKLLEGEPQR